MKKFTALLLFLCCLFYGCEMLSNKNSQVAPECYTGKIISRQCGGARTVVQVTNSDDFKINYCILNSKDTLYNTLIVIRDLINIDTSVNTIFFDIGDENAKQDFLCLTHEGAPGNMKEVTLTNLSTIKCDQNEIK